MSDPYIDTLYQEARQEFLDFEPIRDELGVAMGQLQALFPETKTPRVQTAVTGMYGDLHISDSLLIVGIDYFIGPKATYRPMEMPAYILSRYDKAHLVSVIVKFMAGNYVTTGRDETLLSEMIDFGKTYYLTSRLLPCTPDSILLGYTPKDMEVIQANETIIWANLVENEVLYETSHVTKRRFLGERPNVYEIDQECPGRIGAWVGWQIVESYMRNNDVPVLELLSNRDNHQIFAKSGYKPKGG